MQKPVNWFLVNGRVLKSFAYWFNCRKKVICRSKLNIYMFFYQISRIFFRFLIISWYNFIVFYCIIITAVKFAHTFYKFNQNIYRAKWFTISQFTIIILSFFGLKRFLVSALNTMGGIHKNYEDLPQFNADWLISLRTCIFLNFVLASAVPALTLQWLERAT